jgi:hypothetical protein
MFFQKHRFVGSVPHRFLDPVTQLLQGLYNLANDSKNTL